MLNPEMRAYLHRVEGAPGRCRNAAAPFKAGTLKAMVMIAVADDEDFWRYSIEASDRIVLTTSQIRRLAVDWDLLPNS